MIKNYFLYQDDPEIQMDLVTINEAVPELENFLREQNREKLCVAISKQKSAKICDEAEKDYKRRRLSDHSRTRVQCHIGSGDVSREICGSQSKDRTCA